MAEIPQASKEGKLLVGGCWGASRGCLAEVPPLGLGLWPSSIVLCLVERKGCQDVAVGPVWGTREGSRA